MASLFGALTVAVGGLTAQSDSIGNISDNLANAQTTGYKTIGTKFQSLVTNSNASVNDPGGVRASPHYQNSLQGNLVQSGSSTSLAVSGQGFFAVAPGVVDASGATSFNGTTLFTRAGDFALNKDGYLVNGPGYYLLGYDVNSTTGAVDSSTADPIQLSALLVNPVATTSTTYSANLPANVTAGAFTSTPSTIQIYDSQGTTHNLSLTWVKTAANEWDLTVSVPLSSSSSYTATVPFTFNSGSNSGTIASIGSGSNYTQTATSSGGEASITFDLAFPDAGSQTMTIDFGGYDTAIGVTQFADQTSTVSVSSFEQNGLPRGSFSSLSIDKNGFVAINYNNGSSKIVSQIPLVQFFAADQLQRVSGGAYQATLASGTPRYGAPGTNGAGTIVGGSLESSTVDIASEFTRMIQAQQIYSANAKTITTVNNMLSTIINTIQ